MLVAKDVVSSRVTGAINRKALVNRTVNSLTLEEAESFFVTMRDELHHAFTIHRDAHGLRLLDGGIDIHCVPVHGTTDGRWGDDHATDHIALYTYIDGALIKRDAYPLTGLTFGEVSVSIITETLLPAWQRELCGRSIPRISEGRLPTAAL